MAAAAVDMSLGAPVDVELDGTIHTCLVAVIQPKNVPVDEIVLFLPSLHRNIQVPRSKVLPYCSKRQTESVQAPPVVVYPTCAICQRPGASCRVGNHQCQWMCDRATCHLAAVKQESCPECKQPLGDFPVIMPETDEPILDKKQWYVGFLMKEVEREAKELEYGLALYHNTPGFDVQAALAATDRNVGSAYYGLDDEDILDDWRKLGKEETEFKATVASRPV